MAIFFILVLNVLNLSRSNCLMWRRGGPTISELDYRSQGRWFEPGLCRGVVSLDKKLYCTLSLFTHVYKWVPAIIMLEGNLAMD